MLVLTTLRVGLPERLAADLDPRLPEQVEQELARDPIGAARGRSGLSWRADREHRLARLDYYHDLKKDRAAAPQDHAKEIEWLTAEVRAEPETQRRPADLTVEQQQLIIVAVAAEIVHSQF